MPTPLRILSLGAGVQSTTVALMSIVGELDRLDHCIFADTGWEPQAVYRHLAWLEGELARAEIPVYRVRNGDIRKGNALPYTTGAGQTQENSRYASMPFYVRNPDGTIGKVVRQCTHEYKITPIERKMRELLGLKKGERWPTEPVIEHWFGISADELRRVRVCKAHWKTHRYPLVFDCPMSRHDCLLWLQAHGFPQPPRSACVGCPFRSNAEWRALQANPEEWTDAVAFDEAIRHKGGMRGELFLHRSGVPLAQVDLSTPEERGQQALTWNEECLGYCGS